MSTRHVVDSRLSQILGDNHTSMLQRELEQYARDNYEGQPVQSVVVRLTIEPLAEQTEGP